MNESGTQTNRTRFLKCERDRNRKSERAIERREEEIERHINYYDKRET